MTEHTPNELDWLAFRYIASELSPDEMVEFEERLDEDQQAREAVARATELTDAVAVASAEVFHTAPAYIEHPSVASRADRGRRLRWVAFGAAAALACVFLWRALPFGGQSDRPPNDGSLAETARDAVSDLQDPRFALLWCQTGEELAQAEQDLWPPELSVEPPDAEDEPVDPDEQSADTPNLPDDFPAAPGEAGESDDLLPSWMLAAVAGELDPVNGNGDLRLEN